MKNILTIILGIFAGIFGGAFGQSGTEIMLPGLLILGIVPDFKTAAGTTLLAVLPPISLLAVFQYYKRDQVKIYTALTLTICYFFAAYFGSYIVKDVSESHLEYGASIYFIFIGLFFLWNGYSGFFGNTKIKK